MQSIFSDETPATLSCVKNYEGRNVALDALIPTEVKLALDVGCGRGGNAAFLKQLGIEVDGVSWNEAELAVAKAFCRRVIRCDLNDGLSNIESETYDLIICSHLLEHIAYPQTLLRDLYRSLHPEGYLLVAIPNLFFWSDRLKLLSGKWNYAESGTFDYSHLRWYSDQSMRNLLKEYDFVVDHFLADGWIPLPGLKFVIGSKLRAGINRAACLWRPSLFGCQLIYRCRKRLHSLTK